MDPIALPEVSTQQSTLIDLFLHADPIVQAVMGILLIASVWSWAIAVEKWFSLMGAQRRANRIEDAFWSGAPIDEMSDRVGSKGSDAFSRVFSAGAREWRESRRSFTPGGSEGAMLVERAKTQMAVVVGREAQRLETGLSTLAIIASSTPFIGLLGTVIGIMNSFRNIAAQGETNLAVVAPGITEALFATAMGLGAAIPALIFYNKFSADISKFSERMELFAQELTVKLSQRVSEPRREA
jgi:biopolymer transport protein TolQ